MGSQKPVQRHIHISKGHGRTMCQKEGSSTTDPLRSDCPECMKKLIEELENKLKEMSQ